jgi:hypothetical protein
VERLDALGLDPQGALWLHFPHVKDWRFTVITDLVDTVGRRKAYDLVGSVFDNVGQIEGFTVFDMHLASPAEVMPRVLGGAFYVEDGIVELIDSNVNDMPVDAVVYRLRKPRSAQAATRAARKFSKLHALTT